MFRFIARLFRAFLRLFGLGTRAPRPEELLAVEKENLRQQIATFNQSVAAHADLCNRLIAQIQRQEAEERDLVAQATASFKLGHKEAAGQYALRLQTLRRELAENRSQAAAAEKTYQELTSTRDLAVKAAKSRIESVALALDDLKARQAAAELTELASGMLSATNRSGETLNRLHELAEADRAQAVGRTRVARDILELYDPAAKDVGPQADASAALAEFAAQVGLTREPDAPTSARPTGPQADGRTGSSTPT